MERHMKKKHGIETPDEAEKGPDETWCHICKKIFMNNIEFMKHLFVSIIQESSYIQKSILQDIHNSRL